MADRSPEKAEEKDQQDDQADHIRRADFDAFAVHVALVELRQVDQQLQLELIDDGRGITDAETRNTTSLGLLGMKERALLVGGKVSIAGTANKGTTVIVTVPLDVESESENIA